MKVYRITNVVRAVLLTDSGSQLTELPAGSLFSLSNTEPNSNGMVEGTSNERSVMIFLNDLEERSEVMNVRVPSAGVRISQDRESSQV